MTSIQFIMKGVISMITLIITPFNVLLGILVLSIIEIISGIYFAYKLQYSKIELPFLLVLTIKLIILIIIMHLA